jgi:hypothetical protein
MKRSLKCVFITAATGLLLAGCCSARHTAAEWEYKVAYTTVGNDAKSQEALMNDLSKSGWIFIERDATGMFYFKRAKK